MFEDIQNKKYTSSIKFQRMVLNLLLFSDAHHKHVNALIESRYFSLEPHQMIVAQYKSFVSQFGLKNNIDVDVILNVFHKRPDSIYIPIKNEIDTIRKTVVSNPYIVIDEIISFAREQLSIAAASEFMNKVINGSSKDINESMKLLQGNLSNIACVGDEGSTGIDFTKNINNIPGLFEIDNTVKRFKTYLPSVDSNLCGGHGLAPGSMVCLFAGASVGKSTSLTNIGGNNGLDGKYVVHLGLCDAQLCDFVEMYCSFFTKIPRSCIYKETKAVVAELFKREVDQLSGGLYIDSFMPSEMSTTKLNNYLDKLLHNKVIPRVDVLILDYADKLVYDGGERGLRSDEALKFVYESVQKTGKTFDCVPVTASQVQKEAALKLRKPHSENPEDWSKGYIDRSSITLEELPSDSKSKVEVPNLGLVLMQTTYERNVLNQMDILTARTRNGRAGALTRVDWRPEICYMKEVENYVRQGNNNSAY